MNRVGLIAAVVASRRPPEREVASRYREYVARVRAIRGLDPGAIVPPSEDSHEDYVDLIVSLHQDAATSWDWNNIATSPPPASGWEREPEARRQLISYKPTLLEQLIGRAKARRATLAAAVAAAQADDEAAWRQIEEQWSWFQRIARGILEGDPRAYQGALNSLGPFAELEGIGAKVTARVDNPSLIEALVTAGDELVPRVEYKMLASGRHSAKVMARARYSELYQEFVCSMAIRVAREVFSLLPIARVFVHVDIVRLDPATGHTGPETLLSVEFERGRLLSSNFDKLIPSIAVESFRHAMNFKKSAGLLPVQKLEHIDQLTSLANDTPSGRRR